MLKTAAFLIALPLLYSADDKPKPEHDGTWKPVKAQLGDMPFPPAILQAMTLVLKGKDYTVTVGPSVDKGTVKFLPAAKVQAMDITGVEGPNKGKTIPTIVKLKGDTLTVCYGMAGKRPAAFETKGRADLFLVVYQRQKPPKK